MVELNTLKKQLQTIIFGVDTKAGRTFDILLLVLILGSITILMLESVKEINDRWAILFHRLDWVITGLFTIEYGLRVWTSEKRTRYLFSFFWINRFVFNTASVRGPGHYRQPYVGGYSGVKITSFIQSI